MEHAERSSMGALPTGKFGAICGGSASNKKPLKAAYRNHEMPDFTLRSGIELSTAATGGTFLSLPVRDA